MTSSERQDLFDQTLVGDYDDEAPWEAVKKLRSNGDRAMFDIAAIWLKGTTL